MQKRTLITALLAGLLIAPFAAAEAADHRGRGDRGHHAEQRAERHDDRGDHGEGRYDRDDRRHHADSRHKGHGSYGHDRHSDRKYGYGHARVRHDRGHHYGRRAYGHHHRPAYPILRGLFYYGPRH